MNRRNFGKATVAIALAPGVAPVSVAMSFEERMIFKIGDSLGIEKRDIQRPKHSTRSPQSEHPFST